MKNPNKLSQSPESKRAIVYTLRNRLRQFLEADTPSPGVTKSDRQKAKADILFKIALILNIEGVNLKNANKKLPQIAQELARIMPLEDLSSHYCFAKHIPGIQYNPGN